MGGGKQDKECTLRETARMFAEMGQLAFALQLLCTSETVKRSKLDGCPTSDQRLVRCEKNCAGTK